MESINVSKEILEKALSKSLQRSNIEVISVTIYYPNRKGVNFLSDLFKVIVCYNFPTDANGISQPESIVVKTEPLKVKSALDIVQQQRLFYTELRVLRDVLPKIEKILGENLGPRLWYGSESLKVLLMEDLSIEGFVMENRQTGLSSDQCHLAIQQMAKLHAGSVRLYEKDPRIVTSFNGGIVSPECPKYYLRLMEYSLLNISEAIRKWPDENSERLANKLLTLSETICPRCTESYKYDRGEFCVLNHGDCWTSNIMFKKDEKGNVTDLRFVDYQMVTYTSPAIDLLYFLYTCPEISIKCDMDDNFLQSYLAVLEATMTQIGCKTKPPTMEELKKAIYKRRIYAVFAGIVLYLRMIADEDETEDFDKVFCEFGGETKMNVFKNPRAIKATRKMLAAMDERGYLD